MNTYLQLILPSLVLPLVLSVVLYRLSRHYHILLWGLPLIWLPSYFWLVGWPKLLPQEALDWLWLLVIFSLGVNIGLMQHLRKVALTQIGLQGLAIIILVWPVLRYQPDFGMIIELLVLLLAGAILFLGASTNRSATPSLTLAISSGGLSLITALGGSVLVGQLAGALASVMAAFALYELYQWFSKKSISPNLLMPILQIYLALLLIARIYAEIPLVCAALLLAAPLIGLLPNGRIAAIGSTANVTAALAWLLMTADSSSYY